ncbi:hypothetical protein ACIGXF_38465 [Streptomyces sp. NPDC053086]|uniref:hypothetical protein n=1 Tax=Streptomyces sp. NPDC053086 TaxID=3365698 RepID=UPI0037D8B7FF
MHRKLSVAGVRWSAVLIAMGLATVGCGGGGSDPAPLGKRHSSPAATPDLAAPLSFSQLKEVVDLQSLPLGWKPGVQTIAGRNVPKNAPCRRPPGATCAGQTSRAVVQYNNADDTGNVYLELTAYENKGAAQDGYQRRSASSCLAKTSRRISMSTVGNSSVACTGSNKWTGEPFTGMEMRVGTVAALVVYTHKDKAEPHMLLSLAQMEAARIQQVQRDEKPTATLSDRDG